MSRVVRSIAALTSQRERSVLNENLAKVAFDLILPERLTLWLANEVDGQLGCPVLHLDAAHGDKSGDTQGPTREFSASTAHTSCYREQRTIIQKPTKGRPHFLYMFPVIAGAQMAGILEIERCDRLSPFHERIVEGLLQIYRNHTSLLNDAEFDALTGLLNRRCFGATLNSGLISRVQADNQQAAGRPTQAMPNGSARGWLAVLDLDHFKRVNDQFGHLIGDEVLVLFAQLIQNSFRSMGRAYRFGGEEFVITLSEIGDKDISAVLQGFCCSTASHRFPQVGQVTVSVGYTQLKPHEEASFALSRADKALYFAKQNGRNQVQSYEDLVSRKLLEEKIDERGELDLF